jgi:2,3-bisphosphoglycerate-independent phosphoglycerate mutase
VHAFTDGRDTSPTDGEGYAAELDEFMRSEGLGVIATVSGRYYAMDRDRRWERLKLAYDALVHGSGLAATDALAAIRESYARGETDEFIPPTVVGADPSSRIGKGDGVIFFNFRPDRARELSGVDFVGMTEYEASLGLSVAFPKEEPRHVLAEVISEAGLTQLHIAETEKYAHVTFFFNGGREQPFPGEIRRLIPSPKDVETYDEKPAMSAYEVTDSLENALAQRPFDFVVLNFANPDMVGHTGDVDATVQAIEVVDRCLGRVVRMLEGLGTKVIVTADHGNAEEMLEADGSVDTAHSTDKVPLVVLDTSIHLREGAGLADVAPTLLCFMGLEAPAEMTGRSLCSE